MSTFGKSIPLFIKVEVMSGFFLPNDHCMEHHHTRLRFSACSIPHPMFVRNRKSEISPSHKITPNYRNSHCTDHKVFRQFVWRSGKHFPVARKWIQRLRALYFYLYTKEKKVGKLPVSHRYNRLPLLCSHPGGFNRSWSCRTCRRKDTSI